MPHGGILFPLCFSGPQGGPGNFGVRAPAASKRSPSLEWPRTPTTETINRPPPAPLGLLALSCRTIVESGCGNPKR